MRRFFFFSTVSVNMNTRFTADTDKLNLKFEGYKLRPFQEATNLFRFPLAGIQVYEPTNDQRLGFRDLQARIRHSNLVYGHPLDQHRGSSFCIDQEFNVHMIVYDKVEEHLDWHMHGDTDDHVYPFLVDQASRDSFNHTADQAFGRCSSICKSRQHCAN